MGRLSGDVTPGKPQATWYENRHAESVPQVVVVSATLPHDVLEMTTKFMTDPIRILVKRDELTLEGIKQFFISLEAESYKLETLFDLYDT